MQTEEPLISSYRFSGIPPMKLLSDFQNQLIRSTH